MFPRTLEPTLILLIRKIQFQEFLVTIKFSAALDTLIRPLATAERKTPTCDSRQREASGENSKKRELLARGKLAGRFGGFFGRLARQSLRISSSVVFTQPGGGRWRSQNARSCDSKTNRSTLSRFLSTFASASA